MLYRVLHVESARTEIEFTASPLSDIRQLSHETMPKSSNYEVGKALARAKRRARGRPAAHGAPGALDDPEMAERLAREVMHVRRDETSKIHQTQLEEFAESARLRNLDAEDKTVVFVGSKEPGTSRSYEDLEREFGFDPRHGLPIPKRASRDPDEDNAEDADRKAFDKWLYMMMALKNARVSVTPYEHNFFLWRELWRCIENNDVIVQIVDARDPLLYYSNDLRNLVEEQEKMHILMLNKADLLCKEQLAAWVNYFDGIGVEVLTFSAATNVDEEDDEEDEGTAKVSPISRCELLLTFENLRERRALDTLNVGFVGQPNVGKSSTLNKILGAKRVGVSKTPGATRHLQTHYVNDEEVEEKTLLLCDCPGLTMPVLCEGGSARMLISGILHADTALRQAIIDAATIVLRRASPKLLRSLYGTDVSCREQSASEALAALATVRSLMAHGGVPKEAQAARIVVADAQQGRIVVATAPPGIDQRTFDLLGHDADEDVAGSDSTDDKPRLTKSQRNRERDFDEAFFAPKVAQMHIRNATKPLINSKKHYKGKKEKVRRITAQ